MWPLNYQAVQKSHMWSRKQSRGQPGNEAIQGLHLSHQMKTIQIEMMAFFHRICSSLTFPSPCTVGPLLLGFPPGREVSTPPQSSSTSSWSGPHPTCALPGSFSLLSVPPPLSPALGTTLGDELGYLPHTTSSLSAANFSVCITR